MSDLKWQNLKQLRDSKAACEEKIKQAKQVAHNQQQRLDWIEHYIYQKTPVELSIAQIEARLGHKVILK